MVYIYIKSTDHKGLNQLYGVGKVLGAITITRKMHK